MLSGPAQSNVQGVLRYAEYRSTIPSKTDSSPRLNCSTRSSSSIISAMATILDRHSGENLQKNQSKLKKIRFTRLMQHSDQPDHGPSDTVKPFEFQRACPKRRFRGRLRSWLEIGFDWLCFFAPETGAYFHNPFLTRCLHSSGRATNWLCFFKIPL